MTVSTLLESAFPARVTSAKPETLPLKVYSPTGTCSSTGDGLPGTYGVPHGTKSEMGFGVGRFRGFRLVSLASMRRYVRPPSAVDGKQGNGLGPPHAGAIALACQYTIAVPSGLHLGSARAFHSGSSIVSLPGTPLPGPLIFCP